MDTVDLTQYIQYEGQQWQVLKQYLLQVKESKIGLLVSAKDHDESNKIRGAIFMINQLLALEETAKQMQGR